MLTAGELKKILDKVPDSAKVFVSQDDLAQWFDTMAQAYPAWVDEEGDGCCLLNSEDDGIEPNAVMLFRADAKSAIGEPGDRDDA